MVFSFILMCISAVVLTGRTSAKDFHIIRTFVTVLIFFIATPIIVIVKNDKISKHAAKYLMTFGVVKWSVNVVLKLASIKVAKNKVQVATICPASPNLPFEYLVGVSALR